MEVKGRFPNKMLKKHRAAYETNFPDINPHFTEDNRFRQIEVDRVTGKEVLRLIDVVKITR